MGAYETGGLQRYTKAGKLAKLVPGKASKKGHNGKYRGKHFVVLVLT